jgi:hypothetical protein
MTIIQVDGKEITEVMRQVMREEIALAFQNNKSETKTGKYVYNLKELADFLHCSAPIAQRLKNEGKIPFKQNGRKFIYDCDAVLLALDHVDKKKRKINT